MIVLHFLYFDGQFRYFLRTYEIGRHILDVCFVLHKIAMNNLDFILDVHRLFNSMNSVFLLVLHCSIIQRLQIFLN